ncbi:MAG TPA: Uma2 family endonuclease [Promineifilum sp.]|nr:Uma2 family endonuclease [Promineifilum sp.]HRQ14216.1 Uma2 family endonuclease [Promineifilum sp.]
MVTLIVPERRHTKRKLSYEEYLALPDDGRIVEWVNGEIITHMPATSLHQNVASLIETLLRLYVARLRLGVVFDAPFEVRLWPNGPAREPDVLFIGRERLAQLTERRFEGGPDLVVEVVSPGSVTIDRVDKFLEYEQANVSEYWIIDPRPHQQQDDFYIRDAGGRFAAAPLDDEGVFASAVLPGFRLNVAWLWQEELPDAERITAGLLANAPGLPDELRALYREMARVLGEP